MPITAALRRCKEMRVCSESARMLPRPLAPRCHQLLENALNPGETGQRMTADSPPVIVHPLLLPMVSQGAWDVLDVLSSRLALRGASSSTQPLAELCWECRGGAVGLAVSQPRWPSGGAPRPGHGVLAQHWSVLFLPCSPATPPSDPFSLSCSAWPRRGSTLRSPPATEHGSLHKHHLSFSKLQPQGGEGSARTLKVFTSA